MWGGMTLNAPVASEILIEDTASVLMKMIIEGPIYMRKQETGVSVKEGGRSTGKSQNERLYHRGIRHRGIPALALEPGSLSLWVVGRNPGNQMEFHADARACARGAFFDE